MPGVSTQGHIANRLCGSLSTSTGPQGVTSLSPRRLQWSCEPVESGESKTVRKSGGTTLGQGDLERVRCVFKSLKMTHRYSAGTKPRAAAGSSPVSTYLSLYLCLSHSFLPPFPCFFLFFHCRFFLRFKKATIFLG